MMELPLAASSLSKISIQADDFDVSTELLMLRKMSSGIGAIATFLGLVADFNQDSEVTGLELEHYPGMTERSIASIVEQAERRWPLLGVRVIHRVGKLNVEDQIVFVGVASRHRQAAFDACAFIMDYLKTEVPLWKKETRDHQDHWIDARKEDAAAKQKW